MANIEEDEGTRRDFLFYATGGTAAVGAGAAVWPLINQMNPSAAVSYTHLTLPTTPYV